METPEVALRLRGHSREVVLMNIYIITIFLNVKAWHSRSLTKSTTTLPELTEPALGLLHPVLEHVFLDVEVGVVVVGEELRHLVRLPLSHVGLHGGPRACETMNESMRGYRGRKYCSLL